MVSSASRWCCERKLADAGFAFPCRLRMREISSHAPRALLLPANSRTTAMHPAQTSGVRLRSGPVGSMVHGQASNHSATKAFAETAGVATSCARRHMEQAPERDVRITDSERGEPIAIAHRGPLNANC